MSAREPTRSRTRSRTKRDGWCSACRGCRRRCFTSAPQIFPCTSFCNTPGARSARSRCSLRMFAGSAVSREERPNNTPASLIERAFSSLSLKRCSPSRLLFRLAGRAQPLSPVTQGCARQRSKASFTRRRYSCRCSSQPPLWSIFIDIPANREAEPNDMEGVAVAILRAAEHRARDSHHNIA